MNRLQLKQWIKDNLLTKSKRINPNRVNTSLDFYNDNIDVFNRIYEETSFLNEDKIVSIKHRIRCILEDYTEIPKCKNENCNNKTHILHKQKNGLFSTHCSLKCKANDEETKDKRKKTTLERHGVKNIFENKDKIRKSVKDKYGVEYITKLPHIVKKGVSNRRKNKLSDKYYEWNKKSILNDDKFKNEHGELSLYKINKYFDYHSKHQTLEQLEIIGIDKKEINNIMSDDELREYKLESGKYLHELCSNENWNKEFIINNKDFYIDGIINHYKVAEYFSYKDKANMYYKLLGLGIDGSMLNNTSNKSNFEYNVLDYIQTLISENEVIHGDRSVINPKELDIHIPRFNYAIECNGDYWHSSKKKTRQYHCSKTKECKEKDIFLFHLQECDWYNKQELIKSMIRNRLKLNSNKIYARKCEIRYPETKEYIKFLDDNHIQGNIKSKDRYGLYYNDELVSLVTFSDNNLTRFCNKINTTVIGGFTKLLKHFIRNNNYNEIITFSDNMYSYGELYENNGFEKVSEVGISYFYIYDGVKYHKSRFRKEKIIDLFELDSSELDKTESQLAEENGLLKVYDSGKTKWKLSIS